MVLRSLAIKSSFVPVLLEGGDTTVFNPVLQARATQLALNTRTLEGLSVLSPWGAGLGAWGGVAVRGRET